MCHISLLFVSICSDDEEAGGLEILMEAPEGFRNSDEDRFSESQVIIESVEVFSEQLMWVRFSHL